MALTRLLIAAALVLAWFFGWALVARRLTRAPARADALGPGNSRPSLTLRPEQIVAPPETVGAELRYLLPPLLSEAVLLTMLAALWFNTLGHGQWWLVFLLVAALMELPVRLRHGRFPRVRWREVVLGMARVVAASAILAWRLG